MNIRGFETAVRDWNADTEGNHPNYYLGYNYSTIEEARQKEALLIAANRENAKIRFENVQGFTGFNLRGTRTGSSGRELIVRLTRIDAHNIAEQVLGRPKFQAQMQGENLVIR